MEATLPHEPPAERTRPLGRRIIDTFLAPGELFASFGERPPRFVPLLVAMVVTAIAVAFCRRSCTWSR